MSKGFTFAGRTGSTACLLHMRTVVSTGETLTIIFQMVHAFLSYSRGSVKYKAFKHPLIHTRYRELWIHESLMYLFPGTIFWGRYDDTIKHWIGIAVEGGEHAQTVDGQHASTAWRVGAMDSGIRR